MIVQKMTLKLFEPSPCYTNINEETQSENYVDNDMCMYFMLDIEQQ